MDPRPRIAGLARQASSLRQAVTDTPVSRAARPVLRRTASGFVGGLLRDVGVSPVLARMGGQALVGHLESGQAVQAAQAYEAWAQEVRSFLETISIASPRMRTTGNSARLLSQFSNSQTNTKPATRLKSGETFLGKLQSKELVFNSEIMEYLKAKQLEDRTEKQRRLELELLDIPSSAPGLDVLRFPNRAALHEALKDYPEERTSLEGAMDAFMGNSQDRYRHTIAGARAALEGIGRKVTGVGLWKERVQEVANDTTRRMFSASWSFLSSLGAHAGRTPSESDAELGLKNTIALVGWLLKNRSRFHA